MDSTLDFLNKLSPLDVPEHNLFHYTSLDGFKGIVRDQEI